MTPMLFGASDGPLFGLLHPPEGEGRGHGVLLCPPVGHEYVRSHWALRQVALALSRRGFHCFRFDWFGVGDSFGEFSEATLARWQDDVLIAAQELKDAAGVRKVSLVGLRLGATIAALSASKIRPTSLVLWDPVLDGTRHIAELRGLHTQLQGIAERNWNATHREARPNEMVGFTFGDVLLAEIAKITEARVSALPAARSASGASVAGWTPRLCLVRSSVSNELADFSEVLRSRPLDIEFHTTEIQTRWAIPGAVEELLLPGDAVRIMADYLEKRAV